MKCALNDFIKPKDKLILDSSLVTFDFGTT